MNKVFLTGRLTRNPLMRTASSGNSYCFFNLAVDKDFAQEGQPKVDFIPCIAFRRTAENMERFLQKGSRIAVDGHLDWNRQGSDGFKQGIVQVERVEFLDSKKQREETQEEVLEGFYEMDDEEPF